MHQITNSEISVFSYKPSITTLKEHVWRFLNLFIECKKEVHNMRRLFGELS